jgi:hypothetical protein
VSLLGDNVTTINKYIETLIYAIKEVGLKISFEKTKYAGKNHDIKIANRSFGNVSQYKYFGMTVTN